MPFLSTDYIDILRLLNFSAAQRDYLQTLLSEISDENLISAIQDLIAEIKSLDAVIKTKREDDNGTLVKADVLEWEPGGKAKGLEIQRQELKQQLINLLGIDLTALKASATISQEIHFYG